MIKTIAPEGKSKKLFERCGYKLPKNYCYVLTIDNTCQGYPLTGVRTGYSTGQSGISLSRTVVGHEFRMVEALEDGDQKELERLANAKQKEFKMENKKSLNIVVKENFKDAYCATAQKILLEVLREYANLKRRRLKKGQQLLYINYCVLNDMQLYNIVGFQEEFGVTKELVDFKFDCDCVAMGAISIGKDKDHGLIFTNEDPSILIELTAEILG